MSTITPCLCVSLVPKAFKKAFLEMLPETRDMCGGDGGLTTPLGHDNKHQADEMCREDQMHAIRSLF